MINIHTSICVSVFSNSSSSIGAPIVSNTLPLTFSEWTLSMCLFKWWIRENPLLHLWHMNGFSPVWVLICAANSCLVKNLFTHCEHLWGNWFRCLLFLENKSCKNITLKKSFFYLWSMSVDWEPKLLPQSEQRKFRSPVWTTLWTLNCCANANCFPHKLHSNGFSPKIQNTT